MKRLILTTLLIIVFHLGQTQTKNFLDQPFLEVAGSADTLVAPNEIYIKIIISEKDTRDRISVEELELKMYSSLKNIGINVDQNLLTRDMASNFKYYFLRGKEAIKSKQYILKVGNADTTSKVFIELETLGISNISIDRVSHSDLESIKNKMRSKAADNARGRAIALTKPLNQTVGTALHIVDVEVYNNSNQYQGRLEEVVIVGYGANKRSQMELPKIEFEKIKVAVNINAKFSLNP